MFNNRYRAGDHVTVTNPVQPTNHRGGETGVVVETSDALVRIQQDSDGQTATCYREELSKS
ncbi:hypothetical protein GCM10012287_16730 [Streptomyces daqingensis]|uniref:Hypervirulence associated protein TUDOR domain-containing protein n=1 Tax=Streptomyces daqingensis TaxID=1472640 RepID=A0ABQ2M3S1_9ACTN|nr:hypothetical protein [Streptomyces daqingensis]GGO46427.1 hypothetical protein GCM10012287_16730 [Streptomyces daqingensis]